MRRARIRRRPTRLGSWRDNESAPPAWLGDRPGELYSVRRLATGPSATARNRTARMGDYWMRDRQEANVPARWSEEASGSRGAWDRTGQPVRPRAASGFLRHGRAKECVVGNETGPKQNRPEVTIPGPCGLILPPWPGYPLSGCSPAEPDSVSPGGSIIAPSWRKCQFSEKSL